MSDIGTGATPHPLSSTPAAGVNSYHVRLPRISAAVRAAREKLRHHLQKRNIPTAAQDDAVTVLSELVTNALRHGAARADAEEIDIQWTFDSSGVLLGVTDGSTAHEIHIVQAATTAESGRGLHIVDCLSQQWGVQQGRSGERTVWAHVCLNSIPTAPIPLSELTS